jgi:hypothetical protein
MMRKKKEIKQEDQEEVKVIKVQEEQVEVQVEEQVQEQNQNQEQVEEQNQNNESIINQITLDCLLNRTQYEKYLHRNLTKSINNNDKKFYRKRICNLTKELFKEENEDDIIPPDIKYVFDNYIKICINYFKVIDRSDIIQEEYKEFKESTEESFVTNEELSQSNALLMRSIKVNPGLDNFVTVISTKKQDEMIIPQQRDINLRDPKLKKKGIAEKEKKNIPINYDEQLDKKKRGSRTTELKKEANSKEEEPSSQQQADGEIKM